MKVQVVPIDTLGPAKIKSPLSYISGVTFIEENRNIICEVHENKVVKNIASKKIEFFELAGPRKNVYFPSNITCGIITCGGLCPGINDVIRGIVIELHERYNVKKVLGFKYGYFGLTKKSKFKPMLLDPDNVDNIHTRGGSILGTSRGHQNEQDILNTLVKEKIKILFVIGGDGTMKGAAKLVQLIKKQKLAISVIAVPKTIDNDIVCIDKTFGFESAIQATMPIIESAHEEAKGHLNGVGLVKLMGRESGFIAAFSALSNSNVNFCLVPEQKFELYGKKGFLEFLRQRLYRKQHAVIVVAEGAGQDLMHNNKTKNTDASGNIKLHNIGTFLKAEIEKYCKKTNTTVSVKYIDPGYMVRSVPANGTDSAYCLLLAQNAVHAGMSGRTNMLVSLWHNHFVYVPISLVAGKRKKLNPEGRIFKSVVASTRQPYLIMN